MTRPVPRSYLSRYLLALTPLLLAAISFIITSALYGFLDTFVPNLSGSVGTILPDMRAMIDITVLLTAPVGVFLLVVAIAWMMKSPEMWGSSALALGLSSLAGTLLAIFFPDTSMNRILDLLSWIAYLILPTSAVASIVVIAWTEKVRRSITYSITNESIIFRGGVWKRQEHVLPHNQIVSVVMEQGMLMRLLHTGTIIPAVTQGPGVGARKDTANAGKAGREASRYPLDCLYGIREPGKVMALLEQLISRPAERGEEQVSYLKKIYEKL